MELKYRHIFFIIIVLIAGCKKDNITDPPPPPDNKPPQDTTIVTWTSFNTQNSAIPHEWITCVETDRMNNLWVGTFDHGIGKYDGHTWTLYNTENSGILSNVIKSISSDSRSNIWIGTNLGLSRLGADNSWTSYTTSDSILPYRVVSAVKADKNDILWIGCGHVEGGGLMSFDGTRWNLYTTLNSQLPCSVINDIEVDDFNNKIIATHQYQGKGGVIIIPAQGSSWRILQRSSSIFDYKGAEAVSVDNSNHIWAGMLAVEYNNAGGLWEYDGSKLIDRNPALSSGKLSNRITALANDKNGVTWIATYPEKSENYELAALFNNKWYIMTELLKDFPHLYVTDMTIDKDNRLLLGTQSGLFIIKLNPSLLK